MSVSVRFGFGFGFGFGLGLGLGLVSGLGLGLGLTLTLSLTLLRRSSRPGGASTSGARRVRSSLALTGLAAPACSHVHVLG